MKKILAVLLVAVMAFALSACGGDKESEETVYTLRFAHGSSTSEPIHIAAEYMAAELEERSDGRIKMEIYPSATLADQVPACEMMMDGTLDFFGGSVVAVENYIDEFKIVDLPYLVSDYESADALFEGEVGQELSDMLPDIGLENLGWCEYGFRNTFNNIRPIESADDFKGIKIRAIESPISEGMWTAFGTDPTVMGWSDVYSGLQMGTVEGADGPNALFASAQMETVCKYMSTTQHMYTPGVILASKATMDKLPEDLQALVREVGAEAAEKMKEITRETQEDAANQMEENGLIINEVTAKVREELADMCKGVYEENRDIIGAEFYDKVMKQLGRS